MFSPVSASSSACAGEWAQRREIVAAAAGEREGERGAPGTCADDGDAAHALTFLSGESVLLTAAEAAFGAA